MRLGVVSQTMLNLDDLIFEDIKRKVFCTSSSLADKNPLGNLFKSKIFINVYRVLKIPDITSILVTAVGDESTFESKALNKYLCILVDCRVVDNDL